MSELRRVRSDVDSRLIALENLRRGMAADAGCCGACGGTGRTADPGTAGLCWDCRGTGHPHRPGIEHAHSEYEADWPVPDGDNDEHGPMPIDTDGDGPADQAHTVAVVCWCGVNGCERFRS